MGTDRMAAWQMALFCTWVYEGMGRDATFLSINLSES